MYFFTIGQVSIDPITLTLATAIIALIGSLVVTILNATILETRRQRIKLETEKTALRDAIYAEISFIMTATCAIINRIQKQPTRERSWKSLKYVISTGLPLSLDVYHYTRENPTLFYQLEDAFVIDNFYQNIVIVLAEIDRHIEEASEGEDQRSDIVRFAEEVVKRNLVVGIAGLETDRLLRAIKEPDGDLTKATALQLVNHFCQLELAENGKPKETEAAKTKNE